MVLHRLSFHLKACFYNKGKMTSPEKKAKFKLLQNFNVELILWNGTFLFLLTPCVCEGVVEGPKIGLGKLKSQGFQDWGDKCNAAQQIAVAWFPNLPFQYGKSKRKWINMFVGPPSPGCISHSLIGRFWLYSFSCPSNLFHKCAWSVTYCKKKKSKWLPN